MLSGAWSDLGRRLGRLGVAALALVLLVSFVGIGPVYAVELPAGAPMRPTPDEIDAAGTTQVSDEPGPADPVDLAVEATEILEYAWSLPAERWNIEALAEALEFDPMAAFRFVRDHIRYEPYRGVLRGAEGTLAARAGNSLDRSLLLAALLDEMLVDYEFAFARLDEAGLDRSSSAL
ncbi:MAG: hypothetical protein ACC726_03065, partial [Chloroflexota bacterium]